MDMYETGYLVTPWAKPTKKGPGPYMLVPVIFLEDGRWRISGYDILIQDWDDLAFAVKRPGPLSNDDNCFIVTGRVPKAGLKVRKDLYWDTNGQPSFAGASVFKMIQTILGESKGAFLKTTGHNYSWGPVFGERTVRLLTPVGNVYEVVPQDSVD